MHPTHTPKPSRECATECQEHPGRTRWGCYHEPPYLGVGHLRVSWKQPHIQDRTAAKIAMNPTVLNKLWLELYLTCAWHLTYMEESSSIERLSSKARSPQSSRNVPFTTAYLHLAHRLTHTNEARRKVILLRWVTRWYACQQSQNW